MTDEMRIEAIESISTACEKYQNNYEVAAKAIKEAMDKRFGSYWHVVVGEGFGFEVSFETRHILYLFFGGNLAIVLWKCS
jgi:dynein light chain 4